jgi:type I restriction enzyme S subunit
MKLTKYKLSDVATIVNGAAPSSCEESYYNGNIIWFTPKDLSNLKSNIC